MIITDVFNNIPTTKAESAEEKMEQEEKYMRKINSSGSNIVKTINTNKNVYGFIRVII